MEDIDKLYFKGLTYKIIGCAMGVHNELGPGFLEKVYEKALMIALAESKIRAENQLPLEVKFHGQVIGEYFADIIVENKVILELKATGCIAKEYKAQIINYLIATCIKVGLIINFGTESLEYERFVK